MCRSWLLAAVPAGLFAAVGLAQKPADPPPADKEQIEAALKLTRAAAAEYEFRIGDGKDKPLDLRRDPLLRWSNPTQGEVHGNVFVWTRDGRPLVVGSLFKWFSPTTHMAHEFHSLAEGPLTAAFHGREVWKTDEAGVRFVDVPAAPAPAGTEAQQLLQLKQLAKEFAGSKKTRAGDEVDLRLLTQPVYRYSAPKQGILTGAIFAFVTGTDPDIFLLLEARGKDAATARWQFAATRMISAEEVQLRHRGRPAWSAEIIPWKDIFIKHERAYTTFRFDAIPEFLNDAPARPKP